MPGRHRSEQGESKANAVKFYMLLPMEGCDLEAYLLLLRRKRRRKVVKVFLTQI